MSKVIVRNYSISLDGFAAGPRQSQESPMGEGGMALHQWAFATRTFRKMFGQEGGSTGLDESFAQRRFVGVGATIMGRNMFGPIRREWPNQDWKGWWGPNPPFHHDVFVLTHHSRNPLPMEGGTTFHFVTEGIEVALERARASAKDMNIVLGGGAATVRSYLKAGLIDEMHLVVSPVLLGQGEHLLDPAMNLAEQFRVEKFAASEAAAHYILAKK
jgi:dihydrofolate reductase